MGIPGRCCAIYASAIFGSFSLFRILETGSAPFQGQLSIFLGRFLELVVIKRVTKLSKQVRVTCVGLGCGSCTRNLAASIVVVFTYLGGRSIPSRKLLIYSDYLFRDNLKRSIIDRPSPNWSGSGCYPKLRKVSQILHDCASF